MILPKTFFLGLFTKPPSLLRALSCLEALLQIELSENKKKVADQFLTQVQSQKTQGFCVADFATLSDERRSC